MYKYWSRIICIVYNVLVYVSVFLLMCSFYHVLIEYFGTRYTYVSTHACYFFNIFKKMYIVLLNSLPFFILATSVRSFMAANPKLTLLLFLYIFHYSYSWRVYIRAFYTFFLISAYFSSLKTVLYIRIRIVKWERGSGMDPGSKKKQPKI